jgi:hypothetical protein
METYKVETCNPATGGWTAVATINPDYEASTVHAGWIRRRRLIVIANADEAEAGAEAKAIGLARRLRGEPRVKRTCELDGKKTETVIWENGRWTIPVGIVKRLKTIVGRA